MEIRMSKRVTIITIAVISLFMLILNSHEKLTTKTKNILNSTNTSSTPPIHSYGTIQNKVALITDTQYTKRLIPLILHFHSVLGPDWPIVFYTSQATFDEHFSPETAVNRSAIWDRAVSQQRIDVRILPPEVNLTRRNSVNVFLSQPWLWEQLAPAQHVLVFQADSMICANSHRRVDDWLKYDFVGPWLSHLDKPLPKFFNGGLSLRNRSMILDILSEGRNWEKESKAKTLSELQLHEYIIRGMESYRDK